MMTKKKWREELKKKREKLSNLDSNNKIRSNLINFLKEKSFSSILFYYPIHSEINILPTIKYYLNKKKCLLPRIVEEKLEVSQIMDIKKDTKMGAFNILEPIGCTYLEPIDIVIVPGLGYNEQKYRLGYGGGYYDRFLLNYKGLSIGCFYYELKSNFKVEAHDVPLNTIITERGVL